MPKDDTQQKAEALAQTFLQDDHALLRNTLLEASGLRLGTHKGEANHATVWFKPKEGSSPQLSRLLRQTPLVREVHPSTDKDEYILVVLNTFERTLKLALRIIRKGPGAVANTPSTKRVVRGEDFFQRHKRAACR